MSSKADRALAHRRALRTAAAITLGLASVASGGCEAITNTYCGMRPDSETCCDRLPGQHWDETRHTCEHLPPPYGPLVPPEVPA